MLNLFYPERKQGCQTYYNLESKLIQNGNIRNLPGHVETLRLCSTTGHNLLNAHVRRICHSSISFSIGLLIPSKLLVTSVNHHQYLLNASQPRPRNLLIFYLHKGQSSHGIQYSPDSLRLDCI